MQEGALLWRILDAPVSAVNFFLPVWVKTSAAFSAGFQCFPTIRRFELARYVLIGLPGYLALMYLPSLAIKFATRSGVQNAGRVA
jgi:hypothetical protein